MAVVLALRERHIVGKHSRSLKERIRDVEVIEV